MSENMSDEKEFPRGYTEWECPFCDIGDKEHDNKSAYYNLVDHLREEHPYETYVLMSQRWNIQNYILAQDSLIWKIAHKYIEYCPTQIVLDGK